MGFYDQIKDYIQENPLGKYVPESILRKLFFGIAVICSALPGIGGVPMSFLGAYIGYKSAMFANAAKAKSSEKPDASPGLRAFCGFFAGVALASVGSGTALLMVPTILIGGGIMYEACHKAYKACHEIYQNYIGHTVSDPNKQEQQKIEQHIQRQPTLQESKKQTQKNRQALENMVKQPTQQEARYDAMRAPPRRRGSNLIAMK